MPCRVNDGSTPMCVTAAWPTIAPPGSVSPPVTASAVPTSWSSTNDPMVRPGSSTLLIWPGGRFDSGGNPTMAVRNRLAAASRSSSPSRTRMSALMWPSCRVSRAAPRARPGWSGWDELDRQALVSANDVVDGPAGLTLEFDAVNAFEQRSQHGGGLHSREPLTRARVGPVAETDLAAGIAADVERVGVVPLVLVTIGGGVQDQDPCARGYRRAVDVGVVTNLAGEGAQGRLVADGFVDGVGQQVGFVLEKLPLFGMGCQQIDRVGDSADRGVQRWRQVVDHQGRALRVGQFAGVGRAEQFVRDAAFEDGALAHHAVGEPQHLQAARNLLDGLPIEWAENIEGGSAPFDEMVTLVAWPADEVGDDGQRQGGRQIRDGVDDTTLHGCVNDVVRLRVDHFVDRAQRPGQQSVGEQLTTPIVFGVVTGEGGAAGHPVAEGIQRDTVAGDERLIVAQGGFAFGIAGQRVDPVRLQPHHG